MSHFFKNFSLILIMFCILSVTYWGYKRWHEKRFYQQDSTLGETSKIVTPSLLAPGSGQKITPGLGMTREELDQIKKGKKANEMESMGWDFSERKKPKPQSDEGVQNTYLEKGDPQALCDFKEYYETDLKNNQKKRRASRSGFEDI